MTFYDSLLFFTVQNLSSQPRKKIISKHSPCIIADLCIANMKNLAVFSKVNFNISHMFTFLLTFFHSQSSFHLFISLQYVRNLFYVQGHVQGHIPIKRALGKPRGNGSDGSSTPGHGKISELHARTPQVNTTAPSLVPLRVRRPYV